MGLFEISATYRPKLTGWRDASARFLYDLATNGVPMPLASLKASCDAAAAELRVSEAREKRLSRPLRLLPPLLPLTGAVAHLT